MNIYTQKLNKFGTNVLHIDRIYAQEW